MPKPAATPLCKEKNVNPASIRRARGRLPVRTDLENLTAFFDAFSDNTRARLLIALSAGRLCVCEIAEALGMSVSAVSHQLRLLRTLRLVRYTPAGRMAFYELADDHVQKVLQVGLKHIREK